MDEEEMLRRITGLLEKGCTMLATHHSCGAPLFRCKGEIVCPVCSTGVRMDTETSAADEKASREKAAKEEAEGAVVAQPSSNEDVLEVERLLKESILFKIEELAGIIRVEQDLTRLKSQLDCIEGAVRILKAIEK